MMKKILCVILYFLFLPTAFADDATYTACFTPQQNCTKLIVAAIQQAQHRVLVEAYSFTSRPIVNALINAHDHGVDVEIIFDKSNFVRGNYSYARKIISSGIPTWMDDQPSIAHNKVMIFDNETVETGSFNFTSAAQYHNAENVLIVHNTDLAQQYVKNWMVRKAVSKSITEFKWISGNFHQY